MVLASEALTHQIKLAGRTLRLRYYTETIGSVWDDERTVALSGTDLYLSGMVLNIDATKGSDDNILLEEGRIKFDDTKFFINGSVDTTSGAKQFTVAISGANEVFRGITPGTIQRQWQSSDVYKKIYGRFLPGGSLF